MLSEVRDLDKTYERPNTLVGTKSGMEGRLAGAEQKILSM
jgi:hypothetical protein